MTRTIHIVLAILLTVSVVGPVLAQATEKPDTTVVKLNLGYRYVTVDGNEWRYRKYVSPDNGMFPSGLWVTVDRGTITRQPILDLGFSMESPSDSTFYFGLKGGAPLAAFDMSYSGYRFHPELLQINMDTMYYERTYTPQSAQRRVFDADGVFQWRGAMEISYTDTTYAGAGDALGLSYPATPDFSTRDLALRREGQMFGAWKYGVALTQRNFSDGTTLQPDARTRAGMLTFGRSVGRNGEIGAEFTRGMVDLRGYDGLDYTHGGLNLDMSWDSGLALQAYANQTDIDNDTTENAYTKRITRTGVKASYFGWQKANLRAGVEHRAYDQRLTDSGTSEQSPNRTLYWATLVARPSKLVRVRARYQASNASGVLDTEVGVIPRKYDRGDVQISLTPNKGNMGLTLLAAQENRKNPLKAIDLRLTTVGASYWAQLTKDANLFAHCELYDWDSGAAAMTGWVSDSRVWGAQVQFNTKPKSYILVGYEYARSSDAANNKDQSVVLGFGWAGDSDSHYSIEYRHQMLDDWAYTPNSFRANAVTINGAFKF